MVHKTLLAYPDFNKWFEIHTNDSEIQLWVVMIQEGKIINFYGIILTGPQKSYIVTEKELLSTV